MRALVLDGDAGIDHLALVERPVVEPGPGQVRVAMKAASLNFRDLATIQNPGIKARLPLVPLSDGCGVVEAVGEGVTRVAVGDRVAPLFFQGWLGGAPTRPALATALGGALDGVAQERITLSADGVSRAPDSLSDEEAACLPCAGLTAWRALMVEGRVKPGDVVLVQGTGGVSIFALQFAKAAGAVVIATSSSDAKLERAKALGADHGINYRTTPDWATAMGHRRWPTAACAPRRRGRRPPCRSRAASRTRATASRCEGRRSPQSRPPVERRRCRSAPHRPRDRARCGTSPS